MSPRPRAPQRPPAAATPAPSTAPARYVELVRVSTRGQAERDTPEMQRVALDRLRAARPGIVVERIEALAVSGAKPLGDTAQGRRLMELARARAFDELRLFDVDRALGARSDDPRERFAVYGMCVEAGALLVDTTGRVINPADDEGMGEVDYYLRSLFSARERRKIQRRTAAGKERLAAQGVWTGGRWPYGLTYDKRSRTWAIVEAEAQVVRRIFALAAHGASGPRIAAALNADGVPAPHSARWRQSNVARMLTNRCYYGEARSMGLPVKVPVIVDEALWREAGRVRRTRPQGRPQSPAGAAMLSGRVYCPCGKRLHIKPEYAPRTRERLDRYACATLTSADKLEPPCEYAGPHHRAALVDAEVWRVVAEALSDRSVLRRSMPGGEGDAAAGYKEEAARCDHLLKRLARKEVEITAAYRRDALSESAWLRALEGVTTERRTLTASRDLALQQVEGERARAEMARDLDARLADLRARVKGAGPQDRRDIIAAVIPNLPPSGVVIWPDGRIEVRGLIPLAAQAATDGDGNCNKVTQNCSKRENFIAGKGGEVVPFRARGRFKALRPYHRSPRRRAL